MIDLTDHRDIGKLKQAFAYSFKGPLGEKTLEFLEEFCGFELGGPRDADQIASKQLQYEAGKRDVILTIKTISSEKNNPNNIANYYKGVN